MFSCVTNQIKDMVKKRKRAQLFIEDIEHAIFPEGVDHGYTTAFHAQYLSVTAEEAYGDDEELHLPDTLSSDERQVCKMLAASYTLMDISAHLGVNARRVRELVASIHAKLSPLAAV